MSNGIDADTHPRDFPAVDNLRGVIISAVVREGVGLGGGWSPSSARGYTSVSLSTGRIMGGVEA